MHIRELAGKAVCILGYGREGQSAARALEKFAPGCEITIADKKETVTVEEGKYWLQLGTGWLRNLEKFDIIIKSPGIPPLPELHAVKNKLTSTTQLFLESVHEAGSQVIGVTGTKGKSTTASLLAAILKEDGRDVHLVGNIGVPTLDFLEHAKEGTLFVMEMSSFQLMDLTVSPHIAVITSFFPEHLDYHITLKNYEIAKAHIVMSQKKQEDFVFSSAVNNAKTIAVYAVVKMENRREFGESDAPVQLSDTHLQGRHNLLNIAGAWKVAEFLGVERETAVKAIRKFKGLAHRLQSLGVLHGIKWIDDAISTIPESAIAALDTFGDQVETILLGGQDRGNDFSGLGAAIADSQIKNVILFPESGIRIKEALEKRVHTQDIHEVDSMEAAVKLAIKRHDRGRQDAICLLSPASPSYNMYKNFEEKGQDFQQCIKTCKTC